MSVIPLSLSDDASLEYVLSDIPFFCVGLTALAVFVFFMVMRRINLSSIYLYTSSLLAFGAAILDLTQILLRGTTNTNQGLGLASVTGIVNAREVGLALSFGFRFLFLWAFVAQRPRYEPRPRTQQDPLFAENQYHSASWERWGVLGFMLKWALLGAVISIPILQIVWRIAFTKAFSPVYVAESTVQIVVSALLIAKLFLNLFLSTVAPWWRPFTPYIVPIIALMISAGIGTGNLLFFAFSETTLGRFLQAVEMYGLIISVLIFTFYKVPRYTPPPRKRSSFFTGLPPKTEQSALQVSPPDVETPVIQIGRNVPSPDIAVIASASRESPISRISSWINTRRPPRPRSAEQKLWDAGDAELGISTEMQRASAAGSVVEQMSPHVEVLEEKQRPPLTLDTEATAQNSVVPPMNTANTLEVGTPSTARPYTGVSFASYYGLATNSRLTMPSVAPGDQSRQITESPVYGLDGIIAPTATNVEPDSPVLSQSIRAPSPSTDAPSSSIQRESNNSFDELLRQQTELDKSIAALRLFSPTTTVMSLPVPPEPEKSKSGALLSGRSLSMSSGKSVAKSSVFSLSIFPDPPPVDRSSVYAEPSTSARVADSPLMTARARRQSRIPRSAISRDLDGLSVLGTPSHGRSNSEGTQYDVTSFIDDLTPGPSNEPTLGELLERPEESEASPTASTLRPLLLSSAVPSITSLPPATASSGVLTASSQPPAAAANYEYPVLKPLLLGSSAPSVPSPLSAGSRRTPGPSVFNGPRRPSRPGQGRPVISVPRQLEDEGQDEAEAFERPRRPPALTSEIR